MPPTPGDGGEPHDRTLVDVLADALGRQTDVTAAGFVRLEGAIARQTKWGIGLAGLALILAFAYLGVGSSVRLPGIGEITTSAAAATDGRAEPDTATPPAPEPTPADAGPTPPGEQP